jgi:hypothetical protein
VYHFLRNVTVVAIETHTVRSQFAGGPARRVTHAQRYSLDAAINPRDLPGVNLVIHRMGVGRVTVRTV